MNTRSTLAATTCGSVRRAATLRTNTLLRGSTATTRALSSTATQSPTAGSSIRPWARWRSRPVGSAQQGPVAEIS
jgi:hypothetical protein